MLVNAKLYEEELVQWTLKHQYDLSINLAYGGAGNSIEGFPKNNKDEHHLVSIDSKGNLLGYLGYYINWETRSVDALYAIRCADEPSPLFIRDLFRAIDDIFYKYHLNRIEFSAYEDNPVCNTYRRLVHKCGGLEVGILHEKTLLMDGKVHNMVLFEIMRKDYIFFNQYGSNIGRDIVEEIL